MLSKVEIVNAQGANLELSLASVTNGYLVSNIEGLDPVKATASSSPIAGLDGAQYHSSRRDIRNIVITLDLYPDYITTDVQQLRRDLYKYAMPKTEVTLKFYIDDVYFVYATGFVESLESALFTADPKVDISILCFDPDFYAADTEIVSGSTTTGWSYNTLDYAGTVDTGILFRLNVSKTTDIVTVGARYPDGDIPEFVFLNSVNPLVSGDQLTVSTIAGDKGATRTDGGTDASAMASMTIGSTWWGLKPGTNEFAVLAESGQSYEIEYRAKYGGL